MTIVCIPLKNIRRAEVATPVLGRLSVLSY